MKLPSIFRTATPTRFDIKPRYYDKVKEDIDHRTASVKRELEAKGVLHPDEYGNDNLGQRYGSSLRGAFSQGQIRQSSTGGFSSAGLLRLIIFVILIIGTFGYIYYGNAALYLILYLAGGVALLVIFYRLKDRMKK